MLTYVILLIPALIYVLARKDRREATAVLGLRPTSWGTAAIGIVAGALLAVPGIWLMNGVAESITDTRGDIVVVGAVTGVVSAVTVVLRAVTEEVLFRGLIQGVLSRRIRRFWIANTVQALIFLLPHLLLLAIDPGLWVFLPLQFLAGLVLGWLRQRDGSIVSPAIAHTVTNLVSGVF